MLAYNPKNMTEDEREYLLTTVGQAHAGLSEVARRSRTGWDTSHAKGHRSCGTWSSKREHVRATAVADGRLLGGAIESPAPQSTSKRSAAIASSSRDPTSSIIYALPCRPNRKWKNTSIALVLTSPRWVVQLAC